MGKKLHVQLFSKDRYGRIVSVGPDLTEADVLITSVKKVGMVYLREFPYLFRKNVSEEMLKVGCTYFSIAQYNQAAVDTQCDTIVATVYTQKGAVHAGMLEHFHEIERIAKFVRSIYVSFIQFAERHNRKKRVGMWGQSSRKYESPADFKRRTSQK